MQTIRDLARLRHARAALTGPVALVPTMGALHAGHMALVETAKRHADHVIVSLFVNPMQFAPTDDLARYPRNESADAAMLAEAGVAMLWAPDADVMYPEGFTTTVSVKGLSEGLCGAWRPGHFDGVATVVTKLFGQIRPDVALFGEKDWQQLAVVRRLVSDLDLGIDIIGVPTERATDGLALSSRNAYLGPDDRKAAATLPQALQTAVTAIESGSAIDLALADAHAALIDAGFTVDYVSAVDRDLRDATPETIDRIMAAARIGGARLIDNMPVTPRGAKRRSQMRR
ncbi:MAG: pantoate--beta-alanine ligase [Sphingomonadaceae bacterium]